MSCFKLPMSLCKRIQSALTRFWWDAKTEKKKITWVSWDKMTNSKRDGGLGFRDIQCFNDAMLEKLSWKLLEDPNCLLARILKGKYYYSYEFLKCAAPASASQGWRGLIVGRDLLLKKLGWAVGNGESIRVWQNQWLSTTGSDSPMGAVEEQFSSLKVKDLFHSKTTAWNITFIQKVLPGYEETILSLKPSKKRGQDKLIWLSNASGKYTTKMGYFAARETKENPEHPPPEMDMQWNKEILSSNTAPKIKRFIWKAVKGALPVGEHLATRQINIDPKCKRCGEVESTMHLLFQCEFAQQVWSETPLWRPINFSVTQSVQEAWHLARKALCLPSTGIEGELLAPWICWNLWKARNNAVFNERRYTTTKTVVKAIVDCKEWASAQRTEAKRNRKMQIPRSKQVEGAITCRSDAAWKANIKTEGLGWSFVKNG
ncbi:putative mitochondrial protein [Cardamine amara subsp. amara]|uniref:Mitochondrial protein n=1 Tax=Cardamine amara subsp. amara TaxID=228776 RepID=A0ABD1BTM8_CARAN